VKAGHTITLAHGSYTELLDAKRLGFAFFVGLGGGLRHGRVAVNSQSMPGMWEDLLRAAGKEESAT
jgi:hypothetical protein